MRAGGRAEGVAVEADFFHGRVGDQWGEVGGDVGGGVEFEAAAFEGEEFGGGHGLRRWCCGGLGMCCAS